MQSDTFDNRFRISSARWAGYDYSQSGVYFVTVCTGNRARYFGEIILTTGDRDSAELLPTAQAAIAETCWLEIPTRFPFVSLDAFMLMPDHLHGLLIFDKVVEQPPALTYQNAFGPQHDNLAAVIRGFKAGVSALTKRQGLAFGWQSRYHDRVVRNDAELKKIQQYIACNPARWKHEQFSEEGLLR
ncbi:transposase [Hymenobacter arizonensis]|uniref:REP element-mobilizing transposase RayT n=1 Tax=Hymenobacter arizonensis TaxID=1227077 RepID=A0A1I5ZVR9_HYMAR|nr:transposase [Hymenobacter arizonensis]SFQ60505.1 REP element-mobilizing transposase RayT [Hymenobacter arizonensis]